jgi:hypothetical protein
MDPVFQTWLKRQFEDAQAISDSSDVVKLEAESGPRVPRRYVAHFSAPTCIKESVVKRALGFSLLFRFPDEYLRTAVNVGQVVNVLSPSTIWHPNAHFPFICTGRVKPGTPLVVLLQRAYDILTYKKMTLDEADALNPAACAWARSNMQLFPLTRAALQRVSETRSTARASVPGTAR